MVLQPFGGGKADFVEYACESSNGYSVVGDRYVLLLRLVDAIEYVCACEHACSAVYDKVILCEVGREVVSRDVVNV